MVWNGMGEYGMVWVSMEWYGEFGMVWWSMEWYG